MHRSLVCFSLGICSLAASAQYTAKKVVFTDMGPYTQQELETVAGVKPGQTLSGQDLAAATQRLGDTACFADIESTVDGSAKTITVIFKLKPIPRAQMLHVGFENFVWFTPEELRSLVHAKVPLFHGYVPENGNEMDVITAALNQALAAKGISGKITSTIHEPSHGHPERVAEFVVDRRVVVASVNLAAPPPPTASDPQKKFPPVVGRSYNEGLTGQTTEDLLLSPWLETGYIDAAITGYQRTAKQTTRGTDVAIRGTVVPGEVYRVSSLTFAGTPFITSDAFRDAATLHPEDVAGSSALQQTLLPIEEAYRAQGYMDVAVQATPVLDAATRHVAYTVTVVPGEQYRLGAVNPEGLSDAAQADFDRGWKLKEGDLYNASYVANFLKLNTALRALAGYTAEYKASADPETHIVDLTITFSRGKGSR